jgi:hypothetical protein
VRRTMMRKAPKVLKYRIYSSQTDGSIHNRDNGKKMMGINARRRIGQPDRDPMGDCPNQSLMRGNFSVYSTGYANAIVLQRLF